MTVPFLGTVGQHPSGLTNTYFREGEACVVCHAEDQEGQPGVIPESCTPFSTKASHLCTRMFQECARIFPALRPNAHGAQTRHIFHKECLRTWLEIKKECPACRNPIHPGAMLSSVQKLRNEMGRHPKIWGAIGGFVMGSMAEMAAKQSGLSRNAVRCVAYGTLFLSYKALSGRLRINPNS